MVTLYNRKAKEKTVFFSWLKLKNIELRHFTLRSLYIYFYVAFNKKLAPESLLFTDFAGRYLSKYSGYSVRRKSENWTSSFSVTERKCYSSFPGRSTPHTSPSRRSSRNQTCDQEQQWRLHRDLSMICTISRKN